ncbi:hypothetical protein L7F22_000675 [Adiantum nelumboides]|nr:hypothetical protein [Adiantum nelumboides]
MDSDQAKIFVGGISWETSEEKLKDYFGNFGSVVETVIVKDRTTGRARGFGFVAFSDPATVDRVILEKHSIDGRMVEVKRAVPRDEQQNLPRSSNAISVSGNSGRTTKIFVGGLASTVTEEDFKNYFSQFGEITDVVVMYDPNTQRPRGFGFITFDSEDAVEKVLMQNTFHEIHDKLVEVKKAVPRELSSGRTSGGGGFGGGRGGSLHTAGYGQGGNSGPGNAYNGPRYASPPGGRGGFQSYGPPSYGTPGYAGPGYNVPMNGAYGAATYGGGVGYPPAGPYGGGYGNPPPSTAYAGAGGYGAPVAPIGGFVGGPPVGPRSPWGSSGGAFGGGGSPAAYGTGPGMSGYPASSWNSGSGAPQANGGGTPYSNNGYGYGTNDSPGAGGYPARGMAGGPGGYGDPYSAGWKSGETHNSPAAAAGAGAGSGYGSNMGAGQVGDGAGYGVAGRQTQRGPDARFRPYPAAGERTT